MMASIGSGLQGLHHPRGSTGIMVMPVTVTTTVTVNARRPNLKDVIDERYFQRPKYIMSNEFCFRFYNFF